MLPEKNVFLNDWVLCEYKEQRSSLTTDGTSETQGVKDKKGKLSMMEQKIILNLLFDNQSIIQV